MKSRSDLKRNILVANPHLSSSPKHYPFRVGSDFYHLQTSEYSIESYRRQAPIYKGPYCLTLPLRGSFSRKLVSRRIRAGIQFDFLSSFKSGSLIFSEVRMEMKTLILWGTIQEKLVIGGNCASLSSQSNLRELPNRIPVFELHHGWRGEFYSAFQIFNGDLLRG